jgi:hypothetical protein
MNYQITEFPEFLQGIFDELFERFDLNTYMYKQKKD